MFYSNSGTGGVVSTIGSGITGVEVGVVVPTVLPSPITMVDVLVSPDISPVGGTPSATISTLAVS